MQKACKTSKKMHDFACTHLTILPIFQFFSAVTQPHELDIYKLCMKGQHFRKWCPWCLIWTPRKGPINTVFVSVSYELYVLDECAWACNNPIIR